MSTLDVVKDLDAATMTVTTEFDAPVERVWQLWADPRKLERWWGPPTYPATVKEHDLTPGGTVSYSMTGPDGDRSNGWWHILEVDEPRRIELEDGFADDAGVPNPDMPSMTMVITFDELGAGRTRMSVTTTFPSTEAMQQLTEMGMEEGMRASMGQIDAVLAEDEVGAG